MDMCLPQVSPLMYHFLKFKIVALSDYIHVTDKSHSFHQTFSTACSLIAFWLLCHWSL